MHRSLVTVWTLGLFAQLALLPSAHRAAADPPDAPPPLPAVEVTAKGVEVDHSSAISTDLLFETGEATIKASARPLLDAIAKALGKDTTTAIAIRCFTDDTAPDNDRTGAYNLKLSQQRADAVLAHFTRRGVAAKRMVARGLGRDRPIAENTSDEGKRTNRRIELAIVSEVRAPEAGDLATYTRALKGKGPLVATIATSQGTLHCELLDDKAPIAVANFIGLATGQKPWTDPQTKKTMRNKPFYDGLVFHRVIPHFMIQGGDPLASSSGGPGYTFEDELAADLTHKPGTLAMANAGPATNGSQFFIDEVEASWLDHRHTIFGQCKEVDVVAKIAAVPRGPNDRPREPVTITKVTISRAAQ